MLFSCVDFVSRSNGSSILLVFKSSVDLFLNAMFGKIPSKLNFSRSLNDSKIAKITPNKKSDNTTI